ncbi:hypothetical protein SASPL_144493 [Salvia splendens]|uniref:Uncharacterized protein n=1 Tax=Salvia splendens TaxID=180675 RepID=A0A8X8WGL9_SALSN|nr:hypothetical protein SASPL_144493 [Salvia splendens]
MIHLPLPWKPRATTSGSDTASAATSSSSNCCGLSRLMRRLKKRSKMLHPSGRQPALQCRYDPLSYSLNFDSGGSGDFLDEDYYKFYAFSSRFVVALPQEAHCRRVAAA